MGLHTMRLSEFIDALTDLQLDTESDPEVRLAIQPIYPLQHHLSDQVALDDQVVYLSAGRQCDNPYLPDWAAQKLDWQS